MRARSARVKFIAAWAGLCAIKLLLAWRLPLFADEAFYAWEASRPALAYSDVPGLSAWLIAAATALLGESVLAIRLPFLLIGAALPWMAVRIACQLGDGESVWRAGQLALLLPLAAASGLLALPDVPLLLATLWMTDALLRLLAERPPLAFPQLALALALGWLAHYRFLPAVLAALAALAVCTPGRGLLGLPRFWLAVAIGCLPLVLLWQWDAGHAHSALRFQFLDRHPWQWHAGGLWWWLIQCLVVTPPLFLAAIGTGWRGLHADGDDRRRWLCGFGLLSVFGFGLAAGFLDRERLSLHWPLAGWLLLCLAWALRSGVSEGSRRGVSAVAALGCVLMLAYLASPLSPALRAWLAAGKLYPEPFVGWPELSAAATAERASLPADAILVADNFRVAAQLRLLLPGAQVRVLENPLNAKHGRRAQLLAWGALLDESAAAGLGDALLVVEDTALPPRSRRDRYLFFCALFDRLPPPRVVSIDGGRKRFLLFRLDAARARGGEACTHPVLAWIDAPAEDAQVSGRILVRGWAFKDGGSVEAIEVLLDGRVMATTRPGEASPHVAAYWGMDDNSVAAHAGFSVPIDVSAIPVGDHVLSLRIRGTDGSVEPWPSQRLRVER